MKNIFIVLLFLSSLCAIAQPQIGMSTSYSIAPISSTVSSIGIAYGNTISINCYIKNKGASLYSGNIVIFKRVDTLSQFGTTAIYDSLMVTNFLPNDSLQVIITETVSPTYFKQSGNGNTIVVWPYVSGSPISDSLRTAPVYVLNATGIEEQYKSVLSIFPNPVSKLLFIKTEEAIIYDRISIYDILSKKVMDVKFNEQVDVSELPPGNYWINVYTKTNKYFSAKFIKTE